jgi:FkbM family methyltransferase
MCGILARKFLKKVFLKVGYYLISKDNFLRLSLIEQSKNENYESKISLELLKTLPTDHSASLVSLIESSKSDLHQDLFVLSELNFMRNGFFVEIGATNGLDGSNSFLMENSFGWKGILVEPALGWHAELFLNRPKTIIEKKCIYKDSNSLLDFVEVGGTGLSSIKDLSMNDDFSHLREKGKTYKVGTISLNDLLSKYNAPSMLDYLSIDTEGSELEILSSFDFARFQFKVITCEHNYSPNREKLNQLFISNGYIRKYPNCSLYDDWWVKQ